jgi:hypothetical protein
VIKFFRKIRQKLLLENPPAGIGRAGKTGSRGEASEKAGKPALPVGRYLKYAVGEIVLVVIGILIALWLNNLNQERNENNERKRLRTALIKELQQNKETFINYREYANDCNKKNIIILNISAG